MSFLTRLLGREKRAAVTTSDPALAEFLGQRSTATGFVDPNRASGLAVAQACISVISQNLAAMPMNLYQRADNGGRDRASGHPLHFVLHDQFNPQMTAFEGREYLVVSLLTTGNAFARIETNMRGQVIALHPLHPVLVQLNGWKMDACAIGLLTHGAVPRSISRRKSCTCATGWPRMASWGFPRSNWPARPLPLL